MISFLFSTVISKPQLCANFFILAAVLVANLNAQTTYTFSNCGATGQFGPTQAQVTAAYSSTTLAGLVTINTQGIQQWTVPSTANYQLTIAGAGAQSAGRVYGLR